MKLRAKVELNRGVLNLEDLAKLDVHDMESLRDMIDARFRENERQLFASEGASGGSAWPALSPKYAAWKQKNFPGRKILARKGRLRRSLTTKGEDHVATFSVARRSVDVGTRDPVAGYHAPASIPGSNHNPNLPERDPLQMTDAQERAIQVAIVEYVAEVRLPQQMRGMLANQRFRR